MTILEELKRLNDNEYVYIGNRVKGGFFFIGTTKEALEQLPNLNKEKVDAINELINRYTKRINNVRKKIEQLGEKYECSVTQNYSNWAHNRIAYYEKYIERMNKYVDAKKNEIGEIELFEDCDVIETCNREIVAPFGKIFLVDNQYISRTYWTLDEFKNGYDEVADDE